MYAIIAREPGGPDVLEWIEVPDPEPGPGEVVIEVAASAVNRADLLPLPVGWAVTDAGGLVHATLPMHRAADAHRLFDDGGVVGKVVLLRAAR